MARSTRVRTGHGERTWTVLDGQHRTVAPVERWLEAHRHLWSPNTVRGYAIALAQWWTFLETRDQQARWDEVGVTTMTGFLSWLRNGRTVEHTVSAPGGEPAAQTMEARLGAVMSFYSWHGDVFGVPAAARLQRSTPRRSRSRGLLAYLDARTATRPSPMVRVRRSRHRDRTPVLHPTEIQKILDECAVAVPATGDWRGNLRDRLLFALLAETGCRLGEVLGMRICDFVLGRGGTAYIEVVPRTGNANGARVKMMRPRRVYVGAGLEALFADYLTHLACRADELGLSLTDQAPLLVNLDRPPLLHALRPGTVYDKVTALRRRGAGPAGWSPHWFRHTHATALLLGGTADWVVSRRLGHAHVQTTLDLYGWVREDEALRAAANWSAYATAWQGAAR
ncbi:MAG: tyrosine-type recombinase/integrase [Pseudonocardia sp.]|nr:tyrosine-type recombinase/integrase [Pseudonocardia sp.]